tara:strand:+ start:384 stop:698 length:315 start_codon:yes stop_codon:yes gene_type:complete
MIKFIKFVSLILLSINIASCSSLETKNIKGWLKEGTKEHREDIKESNKTGKNHLKDYLERSGCISGSSAKIVESNDKNTLLYEVICVTNSKKFLVKCDDKSCSK